MSTEGLERAFADTRAILANVKPDQLDRPTPCASWDVRRLLTHIVGAAHWYAESAEAGVAPAEDTTEDTDYSRGDYLTTYDQGVKASVTAFQAPGVLQNTVKLPFGEFPGEVFMGLATIDQFQHGWDLARATGQDTNIDPELAAQLLLAARAAMPDEFRGAEGEALFGAAVDVPESAPPADQLAGFLGRKV